MTFMHMLYRAAACLALAAAASAHAADKPRPPSDPADARAAVPETRYRALLPYRPLPQQTATADQNWQALNQTVGSINSMSLTMGGDHDEPEPQAPEHKHGQTSAPAPVAAAAPQHAHHHHEGAKQ